MNNYLTKHKKTLGNFLGKEGKLISVGMLWTFLGTFFSRGGQFIAFIIVARLLKPELYGVFGLIKNTVDMFVSFTGLNLGLMATRYITKYEDDNIRLSNIIGLSRVISLITGILGAILLFSLSSYLADSEDLSTYYKLASILIFLNSFNGAQKGILIGFRKFKENSYIDTFVGISLVLVVPFLTYYLDVIGAIIGMIIIIALHNLTNLYLIQRILNQKKIKIFYSRIKTEIKILYEFSLPSVLAGTIVMTVTWTCDYSLSQTTGGKEQLGLYMAAFSVSLLILTAIRIMGQVLLPFSVKNFNKNNVRFDYVNIIIPWIISILIGLTIISFPEILSLLFGHDYAGETLRITAYFIILNTIVISHRQGIARNFAAGNYMWWSFISNLVWASVSIISFFLLIEYGAVGRAMAFSIGFCLNTIFFIPFYVKKNLCPKEFVLSFEPILVWILIFSVLIINYFGIGLLERSIIYLVGLISFSFLFLRLWKRVTYAEKNV